MPPSLPSELTFPRPGLALLRLALTGTSRTLATDESWLAQVAAALDHLASQAGIVGFVLLIDLSSGDSDEVEFVESTFRSAASSRGAAAAESLLRSRRASALGQRLAAVPFPTVAGLAGPCHGHASELAAWCDARVVADDANSAVGFPGIHWGQLPDWGGTTRVPRQIDLSRALGWFSSGQMLDGTAARAIGWSVASSPGPQLVEACCELARQLAETGEWRSDRKRRARGTPHDSVELELLVESSVARLHSTARGHAPAARLVGQWVAQSMKLDTVAADEHAAQAVARFSGSPLQLALENVAALGLYQRRDPRLGPLVAQAREPQSLIVLGAGIMGAGIAATALRHGLRVVVVDANLAALQRAQNTIVDDASADRRTRDANPTWRQELAGRLSVSVELDQVGPCDAAIEAVVENPDVKRQVLPILESRLVPGGILASNTSTIPIARLAEGLARPERCCGIHFFNPVRLMPLVEVIQGPQSTDATIAEAVALVKRIGKLPVVVRDSPGFLVNRLLFAYLNESIQLLHEGASVAQIDHAARGFGMPVGPIELCDMIGIDTVYNAGRTMYAAFPQRLLASPIPAALIKAGRLGKKSGAGFWTYAPPHQGRLDSIVQGILETYRLGNQSFSDEELVWRMMLPMLLEATRVLDEHVVRDPRDVDFGVIYGLGFPAYRGGLLYWADSLGAREICARVQTFAALGIRWQPTPLLLTMAGSDARFYGVASK